MIPAVHRRGTNVGGLLRYLFGPGKREEHVDAHLVAAWSNAGPVACLEPAITSTGHREVRRLTELLEQPVASGRNPPRKTVWHCSIRTHPTDRELTDSQWQHIAGEVMAAVGLAPHGDDRAVRWVAVRHAADHIHIVATLVRQDRHTAWGANDYRRAQNACRDLEERYGLYRVAPAGAGSRRWSRPQELNKAARLRGRDNTAPRERLRRAVRGVAAVADSEADFFRREPRRRRTATRGIAPSRPQPRQRQIRGKPPAAVPNRVAGGAARGAELCGVVRRPRVGGACSPSGDRGDAGLTGGRVGDRPGGRRCIGRGGRRAR